MSWINIIWITKGSTWKIEIPGKTTRRMAVAGIWATGGGANYKPVAYELKDAEKGSVAVITREKMVGMIEKGLMKKEF